MEVSGNIRALRIEHGMTQEELAHKLGYKHKSSVSYMETGGRRVSLAVASELASIFGVTIERLIGKNE